MRRKFRHRLNPLRPHRLPSARSGLTANVTRARMRRQRERHARGPETPKPAQHAKPEKRERHDGRGHSRDRSDDASAGSHMPAFLMRPVPQHLIKRKKENEPV